MKETDIHIYEEETNLFWAPVIIVATAAATYILSNVLFADVSASWGFLQIVALLLILLSFYGIMKISDPLYHFIFHFDGDRLTIRAMKGEQKIKTIQIALSEIEALKFAPNEPRAENEALFDYSMSYHLLWKPRHGDSYRRLLDIDPASFVLKVDDIAKIIRFIRSHNTDIHVPQDQASFFNL